MPSLRDLEDQVTSAISDEVLQCMSPGGLPGCRFREALSPMKEVLTMLLARKLAEPIAQNVAEFLGENVSDGELEAIKYEALKCVRIKLMDKEFEAAQTEKEASSIIKQALEDQEFVKIIIYEALDGAFKARNKEIIVSQLLSLPEFQAEQPEGREIKSKTAQTVAKAMLELGEGAFSKVLLDAEEAKDFVRKVSSTIKQLKAKSSNRSELKARLLKDVKFIASVRALAECRSVVSSDLEFEPPRLPVSAPSTPRPRSPSIPPRSRSASL